MTTVNLTRPPKHYELVAPLVVFQDAAGHDQYVYRQDNPILPSTCNPETTARFLADGLIQEVTP